MQGRKEFSSKIFYQLSLDHMVPQDNYYRRLHEALDLGYLYKATAKYYGIEGQQSIDPVVFFKICLVGYLNDIISDRKLISFCSDSLSIRLFIGYDIDEKLPWHSTISRTRQLYEKDIFETFFQNILTQCIEAGLVAGHTQAVDSAFVKANASMDSLELKVPVESLDEHLRRVRQISHMDKEEAPYRKAKYDNATEEQKSIQASDKELQGLATRQAKWSKDQDQRPGAGNKGSKYTSNKTHYSPTDPDARISVKPGKARKLNYFSQIAVDTDKQIITCIQAELADQKDNQCLQRLVTSTKDNLWRNGLEIESILADAGYSSGENYAWLENQKIDSYIPPHGTYKGGPEGFAYDPQGDYWICQNDKKVTFRRLVTERGTLKKLYKTKVDDCKDCPFRNACLSKKQYSKKISITAYKAEYDRNISRLAKNKWHKAKRMSTVEPVFGTLINYLGMRKVNTRGLHQAHKCMLMAASAFNLKKLLKFTSPKGISIPLSMQMKGKWTKKVQNIFDFMLFGDMNSHPASQTDFYL